MRAGIAAAFAVAAAALFAFAPAGRLACDEPYLVEDHPDGLWTVSVCGRAMVFAMPGSGSDARGWIVLRDDHGAIRGVSSLSMLQFYGATASDTSWTGGWVSRSMVFALPLRPAANGFARWRDERLWRWRALLGLARSDEDAR